MWLINPLSNSNKKYIDTGVKDDRKINYTLIKHLHLFYNRIFKKKYPELFETLFLFSNARNFRVLEIPCICELSHWEDKIELQVSYNVLTFSIDIRNLLGRMFRFCFLCQIFVKK